MVVWSAPLWSMTTAVPRSGCGWRVEAIHELDEYFLEAGLVVVLRGWSWNVRSDRWEEGFSHLKQFSDLKGNCRVLVSYRTDEGFPLGVWVSKQRTNKHLGHFDRRQRLEARPGWVWKR
jgi:Helicase associated domain